jgi:23S rRNA (adenine-N6)-dimethyltransferase
VSAGGAHRWGWHRLAEHAARDLVAASPVRPGDLVLDIGAGEGALTGHLLAAGARVVAVELHPDRLAALRRRFADDPVVVVRADATDLRLPRRPFRVVANPPFAATNAVLRRLLSPGSRMLSADLVLPLHAVERWASGRAPGAGRWLADVEPHRGGELRRSAFRPPAPGKVGVLQLRRRR